MDMVASLNLRVGHLLLDMDFKHRQTIMTMNCIVADLLDSNEMGENAENAVMLGVIINDLKILHKHKEN